jgi:large subunit ribosomal protein L7/L12
MFKIILVNAGPRKLITIKEVKDLLGLGLKETKDLIDNCPCTIHSVQQEPEALHIQGMLEGVGAEIRIDKPLSND